LHGYLVNCDLEGLNLVDFAVASKQLFVRTHHKGVCYAFTRVRVCVRIVRGDAFRRCCDDPSRRYQWEPARSLAGLENTPLNGEKEFPAQLYDESYRLYDLPKPERNKPWKFMYLTLDHVYRPLAKSNGQILELTKIQRANSNARWRKLHQFLSDIGV